MPDLRPSWEALLAVHFGVSNRLERGGGPRIAAVMGPNEAAVDRDPPGPFLLPHVAVGPERRSSYIAIAVDDDQANDLRRALTGCIGPTYTTVTSGNELDPDDIPVAAAVAFAGAASLVTRITVADGDRPAHRLPGDPHRPQDRPTIRDEVRDQVLRLQRLLADRPIRQIEEVRPLGRLLRDFAAALERGDEDEARSLLYGGISDSGRLSGLNRHFLTVRMLATFGHWSELEAHPALDDLLRVDRPALVSDALARLAAHLLSEHSDDDAQTAFEAIIAPRFGALVPSVEAIRSVAGAEHYVRWQLAAGDAPVDIARRLVGLSWGEIEVVAALLGEVGPSSLQPAADAATVVEAAATGRFDLVVEVLARVEPTAELVPIVVQAMTATMTTASAEQVVRFRDALGEHAFDAARMGPRPLPEEIAPSSWVERLRAVAAGNVPVPTAIAQVDETAVGDLLRSPDGLGDLVALVGSTTDPIEVDRLLDVVLVLLDRLQRSAGRDARSSVAALRAATIDMWLVGDDSGDRGRAAEVVDQVEALLGDGVSVEQFAGLAGDLVEAWAPFLTDVSFGLTVRLLEILAAARPAGDGSVAPLALAALGRLGPANIRRLDPIEVHLAQAIGDDLALGLDLEAYAPASPAPVDGGVAAWQGSVGIYCLDTAVSRNAIRVLERIVPGADVAEVHDRVASEPLRALARRVDDLVIAWRVAKHAATDALRAERGGRPLRFAAGTGSSSIVRAVLDFVDAESGGDA